MTQHSFLVAYDLPRVLRSSGTTFHRRLNELLTEFDGARQRRALQSVYIVSGKRAGVLAYTIALWAERYGAGPIGSKSGVIALPLSTIKPPEHRRLLKEARSIVEELGGDRRRRENREYRKSPVRPSPR